MFENDTRTVATISNNADSVKEITADAQKVYSDWIDADTLEILGEKNDVPTDGTPQNDKTINNCVNDSSTLAATLQAGDTKISDATFQQTLDNLPDELLTQKRFFCVGNYDKSKGGEWNSKIPPKESWNWNIPANQRYYSDLHFTDPRQMAAFDISGHGKATDFLVFDFDNVLNDEGNFINDAAQKWYTFIISSLDTYVEKSISGHGLHVIAKLPNGKFGMLNKVLHFGGSSKDEPKLEIYYKLDSKYFLFTGKMFDGCTPKKEIAMDEGDVVQAILDEIQKHNNTTTPPTPTDNNTEYFDPAEYEIDCAVACLSYIDPANLVDRGTDSDWLSILTSCKNVGVPYSIVDDWNKRDPDRYNEKENLNRWNSKLDKNKSKFGLQTLIGKAKEYGFDARAFKRKWYNDHEKEIPAELCISDPLIKKLFAGDNSDITNAERIFAYYENNLRFFTDRERWTIFDGKVWKVSSSSNSAIYPFARHIGKILKANAADDREHKIASTFNTRNRISAAVDMIKAINEALITQEDLNRHPNLLNCLNGVVDLETGKLYQRDPKLYLTQMCRAEYHAGEYSAVVDNFFQSIIPDEQTRNALLRFLGYCLTGKCNEEKALFLRGSGGNGKGTLTGTLLKLFGDYACAYPIKSLLIQRNDSDAESATPALAKLVYCRLACAEEVPQNRKLDAAKFKALTGGDEIYYRRLHEEGNVIEEPTHKFIISGNYDVELTDAGDRGIKRRWLQIPFTQNFSADDNILGDSICDINLKSKLQSPDALNGLLARLVDAAVMWYREGLLESSVMKDAKKNFFADQNFIEEFIDANCDFDEGYFITLKEFIARLKNDTDTRLSDKALRDMVKRNLTENHKVAIRNYNNRVAFAGVRWKDESTDEE